MNKQGALKNGKVIGGIDWLKWVKPDGTEQCGYTWNPVGGCAHGCEWVMPDGQTAICYAKEMAERFRGGGYQHGFAHHYWRPEYLTQPIAVKDPASIFIDSMSDLMGVQVKDSQIKKVLRVCADAHWHRFFLLTKNAPRLRSFKFPPNVWVGVSIPPDRMYGRDLTLAQKAAMLRTSIKVLREIEASVKWISIEPLSWDASDLLEDCGLDWAVLGAASHGRVIYAPSEHDLTRTVHVLDRQNVRIFYKSNLRGHPAIKLWRSEFPPIGDHHG